MTNVVHANVCVTKAGKFMGILLIYGQSIPELQGKKTINTGNELRKSMGCGNYETSKAWAKFVLFPMVHRWTEGPLITSHKYSKRCLKQCFKTTNTYSQILEGSSIFDNQSQTECSYFRSPETKLNKTT
ncbi:hypothetical protein CEXT_313641 [Caerostris extrusa]|uniref:Uncharacterized protein n=1 Tax=Caerostris extrusa TaxID=172846 RepID=A0AAV4N2C9_CAEEX|nr:hypothetical protein CEXT_313641 [Caerostris extrusa]